MDFFGFTAPDQAFWLLCAAFYLMDNLVLHASGELIVVEGMRGQWSPAFPLQNYRLRGRMMTLLLVPPFLGAVRTDWLSEEARSEAGARRAVRILRLRQGRLWPFRFLGGLVFLTLFLLGPIVTALSGLGYALLVVAPLHLLWLAALAALLAEKRCSWGMRWSAVASLVLECAVCPGYFANLVRRLSLRHAAIPADPVAIAVAQSAPEDAERILHQLTLLAADLAEHDELLAEEMEDAMRWREGLLPEAATHG